MTTCTQAGEHNHSSSGSQSVSQSVSQSTLMEVWVDGLAAAAAMWYGWLAGRHAAACGLTSRLGIGLLLLLVVESKAWQQLNSLSPLLKQQQQPA
jgi:hypothetical protein